MREVTGLTGRTSVSEERRSRVLEIRILEGTSVTTRSRRSRVGEKQWPRDFRKDSTVWFTSEAKLGCFRKEGGRMVWRHHWGPRRTPIPL